MSPLQRWKEVWERAKQFAIFEEFLSEELEAVNEYAQAAYDLCVVWYGPPLDPKKPFFIQRAISDSSFCAQKSDKYVLAIDKNATTPERLCSDIAHEMYHRVTYGRRGFAGEMWVQEMMAILTAHWFLRKQGFQEYAEAQRQAYLKSPGKTDVALMRASQRDNYRDWLLHGGELYSDAFTVSVGRIGYALIRIVDGIDFCRIIKANALEDWIASLPQEKQYGVCRILEVSSDSKTIPKDNHNLLQFCNALKVKGDLEAAITEFQLIAHLQPESSVVAFCLGRTYQEAKQFDAARNAYLEASELKFLDRWLPYNLATCCWYLEDFSSAVQWYQEAINQDPQWESAYYYLGSSFIKTGDLLSARTAWKKVLTLDGEEYKEAAQKALEDYPFGDTC